LDKWLHLLELDSDYNGLHKTGEIPDPVCSPFWEKEINAKIVSINDLLAIGIYTALVNFRLQYYEFFLLYPQAMNLIAN